MADNPITNTRGTSFAELLVCVFLLRKKEYRWHPMVKRTPNNMLLIRTAIPVFLNTTLLDICSYINKVFASSLYVGAISSLSYATSLNRIVIDIVTIVITTFYYPILSANASKKQYEAVSNTLQKCIDFCLIILLPIAVLVFFLSEPIVTLVFQRGAFGSDSTDMTSAALRAFAIGFPALFIRSLFVYLFYSFKRTKTCTMISAMYLLLYVILSYILVKQFQHVGLAASTGLAAYATLPLYIAAYTNKYKHIPIKHSIITAGKCIISSAVMGSAVFVTNYVVGLLLLPTVTACVISLLLCLIMAVILYCFMLRLMKVDQHKEYLNMILTAFRIKSTNQISNNHNHSG